MKTSEVMTRGKFYKHAEKMILNLDFSDLDHGDAVQLCEYTKGIIARMPPTSLLTLVNVTNTTYNQAFSEMFRDFAQHNKPYVLAGAVVGVSGWRKLILWTTIKLTGRANLKAVDTVEEAQEWLVNYKPK